MTKLIKFFSNIYSIIFDTVFNDVINDIPDENDLRSQLDKRGVITECFYCKIPIRIDGNNGDYNTILHEEYHCHSCTPIFEGVEDYREDKEQRGNLVECFYCGTDILIDGDNDPIRDYEISEPEIHCGDCTNDAVQNLT